VRWLIDRNADLDATDNGGMTAAMYAARNGHVEALQLLADAGADLAIRNDDGQTALTMAQQYNKADCVRIIKR
jgi:ankyrin repeat protein